MTERKIKTEVFSRVSGYFRPVQNWNKGKKEEFRERKFADVKALQMPQSKGAPTPLTEMRKGDAANSGQ